VAEPSHRILVACYGGGHVQSLIPLARELQADPNIELTVIGFTTARAAFQRAGVKSVGYTVFEHYLTNSYSKLIEPFLDSSSHPDVSKDETIAYFHVGMHDLIEEYGEENALKMVSQNGRTAFHPELTLTRYLGETQPDLVITSTSPRSELAMQRAAYNLGITGLAVSDLFLQHEASYICDKTYASHITVIADYVAAYLRENGCNQSRLYVTGNPAFDRLFGTEARNDGQSIRNHIGLNNNDRLLIWIGTPRDVSLIGKRFIDNQLIIDYMEEFCRTHPGHKFAFRPHPNRPVSLPHDCQHGILLGQEFSIEGVLWAGDVIILETSTVGLQAALIGRPVITISADNYPPYSELGLATDVPNLDALENVLLNPKLPQLDLLGPEGMGDACDKVLRLVYDLLEADYGLLVRDV
jgi:hypothetical protein